MNKRVGMVLGVVAVTAVAVVGWDLVFGESSPAKETSQPVHTARGPSATQAVRTPASDPCDNIYRIHRLTRNPKPILYVSGCEMEWMVQKNGGGVILIGEDGEKQKPIREGEDRGRGPTVKMWQAEGNYAVVEAKFYRP